jgi:hypothetical protein
MSVCWSEVGAGTLRLMPSGSDLTDRSLVRTDFSDQAAWEAVRDAALAFNEDGFAAGLTVVDDPAFDGVHADAILASASGRQNLCLVVDSTALTHPENPILVLGSGRRPDRFRVIPSEVWSVENNLFWNMDWREFIGGLDQDGVFRGFR